MKVQFNEEKGNIYCSAIVLGFTAQCMCCYCIRFLCINSNYCIKSFSSILPVSCLEGIIYCSEILHHSSDDMASPSINSIDRDNMYPYLSLSAGVQAWGKGQRCLSSQKNKATQNRRSVRLECNGERIHSYWNSVLFSFLGQIIFINEQIFMPRQNLQFKNVSFDNKCYDRFFSTKNLNNVNGRWMEMKTISSCKVLFSDKYCWICGIIKCSLWSVKHFPPLPKVSLWFSCSTCYTTINKKYLIFINFVCHLTLRGLWSKWIHWELD